MEKFKDYKIAIEYTEIKTNHYDSMDGEKIYEKKCMSTIDVPHELERSDISPDGLIDINNDSCYWIYKYFETEIHRKYEYESYSREITKLKLIHDRESEFDSLFL